MHEIAVVLPQCLEDVDNAVVKLQEANPSKRFNIASCSLYTKKALNTFIGKSDKTGFVPVSIACGLQTLNVSIFIPKMSAETCVDVVQMQNKKAGTYMQFILVFFPDEETVRFLTEKKDGSLKSWSYCIKLLDNSKDFCTVLTSFLFTD